MCAPPPFQRGAFFCEPTHANQVARWRRPDLRTARRLPPVHATACLGKSHAPACTTAVPRSSCIIGRASPLLCETLPTDVLAVVRVPVGGQAQT